MAFSSLAGSVIEKIITLPARFQEVRRVKPHKRELNKAVLVKLLNGTHHFGLSATVVFLINSGYIFYPSGLQKDSTISAVYPLSV